MLVFPSANKIFFKAATPGSTESGAKLDTAYVEFVNGGTVPDVMVPPNTLRAYFDSLASTSDRDYLRVPILSHSQGQTEDGRPQLTLIVATDGITGVHGKPFSSAVSSRIYAITIAASQADIHDDIFAARHHYAEVEQLEKPDNGSVMLTVFFV